MIFPVAIIARTVARRRAISYCCIAATASARNVARNLTAKEEGAVASIIDASSAVIIQIALRTGLFATIWPVLSAGTASSVLLINLCAGRGNVRNSVRSTAIAITAIFPAGFVKMASVSSAQAMPIATKA